MKIAVLLSGGVDSSVAMHLLHEQGHDITAFYLKVWLQDDLAFLGNCPWEEDVAAASAVAEKLGIPFQVVSMQEAYWDKVVSYTIAEIKRGRTPNPDMMCNVLMKFGHFHDAYGFGFDAIASGHYAHIYRAGEYWQSTDFANLAHNAYNAEQAKGFKDRYLLATSVDTAKDQTYFLSRLSARQLSRCLFPLAKYTKTAVRSLARQYGLSNAERKDSQGVCFLGKIKFSDFIAHHFGLQPGAIVHAGTNEALGEHNGYWFYTIGQRRGLGLGNGPWHVCEKDVASNTVYVCHPEEAPRATQKFVVEDVNFLLPFPLEVLFDESMAKDRLRVKIRHGGKEIEVKSLQVMQSKKVQMVQPLEAIEQVGTVEKSFPTSWEVELKKPENGVASGQFAAFYLKDICLGSGVIVRSILHHIST